MTSPFIPPLKGKGLTVCTCENCGEQFRQRGTIVTHVKNGGKYCSRFCQQEGRRKNKARGSMWTGPEPYTPSREEGLI
jgi:hypothetical protein